MADPTEAAAAQQVAQLEAYFQKDSANLHLQADLADAYLRLGLWAQARQMLGLTLAAQPQDTLARYRLAVVERAEGHVAAAVGLLQGLRQSGVSDPAVLHELALSLAAQNAWPAVAEALSAVDAALLPPEQGDDIWFMRVRARHYAMQLDEAAADGQAWMAARGHALPAQAAGALATLFLDCGRYDLVQQVTAADGAAATQNAELLAASGYMRLAVGQGELAAADFASSTELSPTFGRAHLGRGLAAAMMGHMDEALAALKQATQAMPEHLGGWHALAWMHLIGRDLAAAEQTFNAVLEIDRNFGDTYGGLALVAALSGDRKRSVELLRTALRLDAQSMNAAIARMVLDRHTDLSDPNLLRDGLRQILRTASIAESPAAPMVERLAAAIGQQR